MVWLSEAKATDQLSRAKAWNILVFHLFGAELVDRMNDEGALYAECRPISAVNPFNLSIDETIGGVG